MVYPTAQAASTTPMTHSDMYARPPVTFPFVKDDTKPTHAAEALFEHVHR